MKQSTANHWWLYQFPNLAFHVIFEASGSKETALNDFWNAKCLYGVQLNIKIRFCITIMVWLIFRVCNLQIRISLTKEKTLPSHLNSSLIKIFRCWQYKIYNTVSMSVFSLWKYINTTSQKRWTTASCCTISYCLWQ